MSLGSSNHISATVPYKKLFWIIEKLGYAEVAVPKDLKYAYKKMYFWHPEKYDLTYVGVELNVRQIENDEIIIETRTRAGRSYLELQQQNQTIKIIKEFFGGYYRTDYGKNKLFPSDECNPEKTDLEMALYVQRWIFNNALTPLKIYVDFISESIHTNGSAGDLYSDATGVLPFIDGMRPVVVSNNIQLPYLIGAWENYIKNVFLVVLKYGDVSDKFIRPDKLSADDLIRIKNGEACVEECLVNRLSFQRPYIIISNFKQLDSSIDVNGIFQKPFKRRKTSLYTQIDDMIDLRNKIVHDGFLDANLTQKDISKFIENITEVADRLYKVLGKKYNFEPNFHF